MYSVYEWIEKRFYIIYFLHWRFRVKNFFSVLFLCSYDLWSNPHWDYALLPHFKNCSKEHYIVHVYLPLPKILRFVPVEWYMYMCVCTVLVIRFSKNKNQYLDLEVPTLQNTTETVGRNKTRLRCLNIDSDVPKCEVGYFVLWFCKPIYFCGYEL